MHLIAKHPYIKMERQVTSTGQFEIENERFIYLYEHKVMTQYREFPIEDVIDFSYRKISHPGGILYLHTTHGVYSYTVKTSPTLFIEAYKERFT